MDPDPSLLTHCRDLYLRRHRILVVDEVVSHCVFRVARSIHADKPPFDGRLVRRVESISHIQRTLFIPSAVTRLQWQLQYPPSLLLHQRRGLS